MAGLQNTSDTKQIGVLTASLYSRYPLQESPMSAAKPVKAPPAIDPFGLTSPAQAELNKKKRDERRKLIRSQNIRSKMK